MATLPASNRATADNPTFGQRTSSVPVEFLGPLSPVAFCREELILFTRRRMLDWKSQATNAAVIAAGSALIFLAWKSLVTWIA
jgi:hypothetical protein